ncbi:hypothetical protein SARC_11795, partial [Sphaeroforma arctica JP610]
SLDKPPAAQEAGEESLDEGEVVEEADLMAKLMGFSSFDSTQGQHVPGTDVSGVIVKHKREYRQYMNRRGGFNKPLPGGPAGK